MSSTAVSGAPGSSRGWISCLLVSISSLTLPLVYDPDLKIQRYIYIFLRLIHLLAHHPDYATDPEDLRSIAKSVQPTSVRLVRSSQAVAD